MFWILRRLLKSWSTGKSERIKSYPKNSSVDLTDDKMSDEDLTIHLNQLRKTWMLKKIVEPDKDEKILYPKDIANGLIDRESPNCDTLVAVEETYMFPGQIYSVHTGR